LRESGTVFAVPNVRIHPVHLPAGLTGLGQVRSSGCRRRGSQQPPRSGGGPDGLAVRDPSRVLLRSTALTGVEPSPTGSRHFGARRPRTPPPPWHHGRHLVTMFLGISFLASRGHPLPSETKSVVAQLADGVFHGGSLLHGPGVHGGHPGTGGEHFVSGFPVFPRSSPAIGTARQFENRGDRLVSRTV